MSNNKLEDFIKLKDQLKAAATTDQGAFICGGTVPNTRTPWMGSLEDMTDEPPDSTLENYPDPWVTIRWDLSTGEGARKLKLPIIKAKRCPIDEILEHYHNPSSGDVLDPFFKVATLDYSQFSTDFSPGSLGILDAVAQILLPGRERLFPSAVSRNDEHLGIRTELCTLNVYTGPSKQLFSYVDTPPSEHQFGYLIVGLPSMHKGGHLRVVHKDEAAIWKWGGEKANTIEWVAFTTDCESVVHPIWAGYHITLKYRLYLRDRVSELTGCQRITNPNAFPLVKRICEALRCPLFLPNGGTLGLFCEHRYNHTHPRPFLLKGIDMIICNVFEGLHLDTELRPVLDWGQGDQPKTRLVGRSFRPLVLIQAGRLDWKSDRRDIIWMNERKWMEPAVVHLQHVDNRLDLVSLDSAVAILVKIPNIYRRMRAPPYSEDPMFVVPKHYNDSLDSHVGYRV